MMHALAPSLGHAERPTWVAERKGALSRLEILMCRDQRQEHHVIGSSADHVLRFDDATASCQQLSQGWGESSQVHLLFIEHQEPRLAFLYNRATALGEASQRSSHRCNERAAVGGEASPQLCA